jgi:hypothetical protein
MIILLSTLSHPLSQNLSLPLLSSIGVNTNFLLFLHQTVFPRCFSTWSTTNMSASILKITPSKSLQLGALPANLIFTFPHCNGSIHPLLLKVFMRPRFPTEIIITKLLTE